jgi:3-hydroxyisobutyrate dehydrogenase
MDLKAPGLELAMKLYQQLADQGGENLGTQALYQLY